MASKTEIANRALAILGQSQVADIDTDTSVAAKRILAAWTIARQEAIRAHAWTFSVEAAELTADGAYTPIECDWRFRYPVPSDYLGLISYNGRYTGALHTCCEMRQGMIYSNESRARITYTKDVVETGNWDPSFIMPFAYKLAEMTATQFNADTGQTAVMLARVEFEKVIQGLRGNARETRPKVITAIQGSAYLAARQECGVPWYIGGPGIPAEYEVGPFNPFAIPPP